MQALGQPARAAVLLHIPFSCRARAAQGSLPARGREADTSYRRVFLPTAQQSHLLCPGEGLGCPLRRRHTARPSAAFHEPDLVPFVQADGRGWTEAAISSAHSALEPHRGEQGNRCRQQLHQPPSQPPPAAPRLFAGCVSVMDGADMLNYSGWMSSESW